jgi:hypothetical protein
LSLPVCTALEKAVAMSPASMASAYSASAFRFRALLFSTSPLFRVGGLPSKTKTSLILWSAMSRVVLKASPTRWEVTLPSRSLRGLPSLPLMRARNWWRTLKASTAMERPLRSSRLKAFFTIIGVRLTPNWTDQVKRGME